MGGLVDLQLSLTVGYVIVCCVCVWLNQCCLACRPVAADPKASRALLNPSELRFLRYVSHSLLSTLYSTLCLW